MNNKTPISMLQELMVQRKKGLPDYVTDFSDMPEVAFKCTVTVDQICVTGYGPTKKDAKQNSAQIALESMGFTTKVPNQMLSIMSSTAAVSYSHQNKNVPFFNYVGKLNEYASTNGQMYPTYIDETVLTLDGRFVTYCNFLNLRTDGHGLKKKDSKQDAARKMLNKLRSEDVISITKTIRELHIEKIQRVDTLNEEILKKYESITATGPEQSGQKIIEIKAIPNLKITVTTLEELKCELEKFDYKYTIETFQKDPWIMMMKIADSDITIMGKGDTKSEALTDLYETGVQMFSQGLTS